MLLRPAALSLVLALALAANGHAHPGHSGEVNEPHSVMHYATHPDHVIVWIVALAAALMLWQDDVNRGSRRLIPAYARAAKVRPPQ